VIKEKEKRERYLKEGLRMQGNLSKYSPKAMKEYSQGISEGKDLGKWRERNKWPIARMQKGERGESSNSLGLQQAIVKK